MNRGKEYRIIVADDHQDFIEGVKLLLAKLPQFSLIGEARNGMELLCHPKLYTADIVMIDINMPDIRGIEVGRSINFYNSHIKLIAVSLYDDQVYLQELITSGFKGFISKVRIAKELGAVLTNIIHSQLAFPKQLKLALK